MFKNKSIYLFAALTSIILSIWMAYRETVINPDAICYLQSAAIIGAGGLRKAMNFCGQAQWPFYSVIIYFTAHFLQITYEAAAFSLDTIFTTISVLSFIAIVSQLGGTRRLLGLACFVILLAHQFNSIRQYIIRDHGFIAFYALSIIFLLKYFTNPRFLTALLWSFTLMFATLFRIEGAVFLTFLPFLIFMNPSLTGWQKTKAYLELNLMTLTIGFSILGWLIFHPEISLASLGRVQELVFQFLHAGGMIWQRFNGSTSAFYHGVLSFESIGDAKLVFFLTLTTWYFVRASADLSLIFTILLVYAVYKKSLQISKNERLVLWGYVIANLLVTGLFFAQHLFLSKRYLIALTFVLMLWVPFAMNTLVEETKLQKISYRVVPLILMWTILASLGGIFDFGYSKAYMRDAGSWLAANVQKEKSLYSNDCQIMYYSKHFGNDIFTKWAEFSQPKALAHDRLKVYNYLAFRVNKSDPQFMQWVQNLKMKPIKVFANKRGDQVRVYKGEG